MLNIDFDNPAPQLICHPDLRIHEKEILTKLNPYFLRDHFILFSSGTTGGDLKGYALSKKALFANAEAVNAHFQLTKNDTWGLSLPVYHVGGLSVLARAHLLGTKVVDLRSWDPENWSRKLEGVSITTIVPTQLYDLVKRNIASPSSLKYLVVGGDYLSSALKTEALKLGWPVIRTFGMSEVSSQLASSKSPLSDDLEILPIHEVKTDEDRLMVKSSALFTLEFIMGDKFIVNTRRELCDKEGHYITKDRARLEGNKIIPLGRIGDEVKISGHLVNLNQLKETLSAYLLEKNLFNQMEFCLEEDDRKGKKLILLTLPEANSETLIEEIKSLIRPVRIDEVRAVDKFVRTALGKLKK
ncbi:MAG: AMP-binding protein [Bacteriovoracia bacterium]